MEMSEVTSLSIPNAGSMFGRRHRWRAKIKSALGQPLVFASGVGGGGCQWKYSCLRNFSHFTSGLNTIIILSMFS